MSKARLNEFASVLKVNLAILLCEQGMIAHIWDLYHTPLPFPNLVYDRYPQAHESRKVKLLAQSASSVDAFVLRTSVYITRFPVF
jgi:hypothetical protein